MAVVLTLGVVIGISLVFVLLGIIISLGEYGLFDWISQGFESLSDLLGSDITNILISVVILIFLINLGRFILSFIGENSGQSANT